MKKTFRILKFKKATPIFEIKNVSKNFNGRPILKKLSLKVYPGEIVGLLGPNGAEKVLYLILLSEQKKLMAGGFCEWKEYYKYSNSLKIKIRLRIFAANQVFV